MFDQDSVTQLNDEELVSQIKTGNENALRILGEKYTIELVKITEWSLKRYIKNPDRSDIMDIANRSLEKMLTKIDTYDKSKAKVKTWAGAIVRNTAVDFLRAKNKVQKQSLNEKMWEKVLNINITEEIRKELKANYSSEELIDLIFEKLSTREKEVIELIRSGANHNETSDMLGIKYENAKTIYCRIIKKARLVYEDLISGLKK